MPTSAMERTWRPMQPPSPPVLRRCPIYPSPLLLSLKRGLIHHHRLWNRRRPKWTMIRIDTD
eukprot:3878189-Pyramimonas_sp.AAC.1